MAWVFLCLALGQHWGLWRLQDLAGHSPDLCVFHRLTGLSCPGCGMGRALLLLAQGRVRDAWSMHPFALPLLGLAWLAALAPAEAYRRLMGARWTRILFLFLGVGLCLRWLLVLLVQAL